MKGLVLTIVVLFLWCSCAFSLELRGDQVFMVNGFILGQFNPKLDCSGLKLRFEEHEIDFSSELGGGPKKKILDDCTHSPLYKNAVGEKGLSPVEAEAKCEEVAFSFLETLRTLARNEQGLSEGELKEEADRLRALPEYSGLVEATAVHGSLVFYKFFGDIATVSIDKQEYNAREEGRDEVCARWEKIVGQLISFFEHRREGWIQFVAFQGCGYVTGQFRSIEEFNSALKKGPFSVEEIEECLEAVR